MLSAYMYRVRKSLLKKPLKFLLLLLAVAMSVFMIFFPTLMAGDEDAVVRNPNLVLGGITLVLIVLFDFMFYSGIKSGVVGFTLSDVNFHMAGPFSPKFNLIILVEGVLSTCAVLLWVLSCQVAVLYQMFGVSSGDVVALLVSGAVAMLLGYLLSCFMGAKFAENEAVKKRIIYIWLAVNVIFIAGFLAALFHKYGSFDAISVLGIRGVISEFGTSIFAQSFPVAGWIALIYSGIVKNSLVYVLVGAVLVILSLAAIYFLYSKNDLDYYETAIANAQKVADLTEARKAGVDTDTANINRKIKVGNETLNSGWGTGAFTSMHLLQNKRATKLFFVNSLALLYRVICLAYMFFMKNTFTEDDKVAYLVMGLTMMTLLNVVVYGGGKTVLEFNKPFIYMVPGSASAKLFSCLLADLPEILFDSLLCALIIGFMAKTSILMAAGVFILMVIFDYLCELTALVEMRLFRGLGRFLLMFLRYFIVFVLFVIILLPGAIVMNMTGSFAWFVIVSSAIGVVITAIMLFVSRNIIDYVEYEK